MHFIYSKVKITVTNVAPVLVTFSLELPCCWTYFQIRIIGETVQMHRYRTLPMLPQTESNQKSLFLKKPHRWPYLGTTMVLYWKVHAVAVLKDSFDSFLVFGKWIHVDYKIVNCGEGPRKQENNLILSSCHQVLWAFWGPSFHALPCVYTCVHTCVSLSRCPQKGEQCRCSQCDYFRAHCSVSQTSCHTKSLQLTI